MKIVFIGVVSYAFVRYLIRDEIETIAQQILSAAVQHDFVSMIRKGEKK